MIFKKKMVTPDKVDWHDDPDQLSLMNPSAKVSITDFTASKTLVIFVGGALDTKYRPLLNGVFIPYRLKYAQQQDIAYLSHATTEQGIELVRHWFAAGNRICLVGHSWGGKTVLQIANKLALSVEIELLVTLDPVSRRLFRRQLKKPVNVKQWINVHVDYRHASMEYSNVIARMGGYWGYCRYADRNIKLSRDADLEITHVQAARMFKEVVDEVIKL